MPVNSPGVKKQVAKQQSSWNKVSLSPNPAPAQSATVALTPGTKPSITQNSTISSTSSSSSDSVDSMASIWVMKLPWER